MPRLVDASEERIPQAGLFFLFVVHGVLAKSRAEFLQLQFFAAWLLADTVVVVACLFADEKNPLFLLAFGSHVSISSDASNCVMGDGGSHPSPFNYS